MKCYYRRFVLRLALIAACFAPFGHCEVSHLEELPSAERDGLRMYVRTFAQHGQNGWAFYCKAYLKNISQQAITVATDCPDGASMLLDSAVFSVEPEELFGSGVFAKPPASRLGLVTLAPGEVTTLPKLSRYEKSGKLTPGYRYIYTVDESMLKFFKLWTGVLTVEIVSKKVDEPVNEKSR